MENKEPFIAPSDDTVEFRFSGQYGTTNKANELIVNSGRADGEKLARFEKKVQRSIVKSLDEVKSEDIPRFFAIMYSLKDKGNVQYVVPLDLNGQKGVICAVCDINSSDDRADDGAKIAYISVGLMTYQELEAHLETMND